MNLIKAGNRRLKKEFLKLYYRVYSGHKCNRDNFNHNAANFLYRKDSFSKNCFIEPVLVYDSGHYAARAIFLHHPLLDSLQLGFFEALPGCRSAVDLLLEYAAVLAENLKTGRVIIGLNGHLTYGVGFLKDNYSLPAVFDGAYTPPYYPSLFSGRGFTEHELTTYYAATADFAPPPSLLRKINTNISYRFIRLHDLKREMEILGDLFNRTLNGTHFYFNKKIIESFEMIKMIRPLLNRRNIIYAVKEGREIGFAIWHPNFNEVLGNNRRVRPLNFFIRCKLHGAKIKDFKVNTIGVLPEYSNSGVSLGMINEIYKQVSGVYQGGETNFVWNDNYKSSRFCAALCRHALRRYAVYEWDLARP
ncbi:MAG: hypothetical protein LBJ14_02360 [Desulfarculales bacterium]|jgi:hypothetical protein|nr:hypothetical protein [Desulfarculales bacterium]